MKKKYFSFLVILTIASLLTGCKCSNSNNSTPVSNNSTTNSVETSADFNQFSQDLLNAYNEQANTTNATNSVDANLIPVTFVRAKDGDTIVVNKEGSEVTIRLIGIDTPESVHPDKDKNTIEGENASEYTKNLLKNYNTLYLEYDKQAQDKYGRDLCYVWLSNDTSDYNNLLNYKLVQDGWAVVKTYKPNVKYQDILKGI